MGRVTKVRAAKILAEANLPAPGLNRLRDNFKSALDVLATDFGQWPNAADARAIDQARAELCDLLRPLNWVSPALERELRRIELLASLSADLRHHHAHRPWLAPVCADFLQTWRALTTKSDKIWRTDVDESPALKFLHACVLEIDPGVPSEAIYDRRKLIHDFAGATQPSDLEES